MAQDEEVRARTLAIQCRRQAAASDTEGVREILTTMADDYDRLAAYYARLSRIDTTDENNLSGK